MLSLSSYNKVNSWSPSSSQYSLQYLVTCLSGRPNCITTSTALSFTKEFLSLGGFLIAVRARHYLNAPVGYLPLLIPFPLPLPSLPLLGCCCFIIERYILPMLTGGSKIIMTVSTGIRLTEAISCFRYLGLELVNLFFPN